VISNGSFISCLFQIGQSGDRVKKIPPGASLITRCGSRSNFWPLSSSYHPGSLTRIATTIQKGAKGIATTFTSNLICLELDETDGGAEREGVGEGFGGCIVYVNRI
jgi:hypothetical protein